jgi:hypothetical protein
VRKFFTVLLFTSLLLLGDALAKEPLRTEESIAVETGKVVQSGILADSNGLLFIEFSKNARVVITSTGLSFSGEIVPPQIIALPDKKPRARMGEVITFELLGDTAEHLTFADQFDLMSWRSRMRSRYLNPAGFSRTTTLVQLLMPIYEEYGELALWEYNEQTGWNELGGTLEDSTDGSQVFSSSLTGTGIFTLFDGNPPPDFIPPFPLDEVILVEPDPFAEEYYTDNAAYSTESGTGLFEDVYLGPDTNNLSQAPIEGEYNTIIIDPTIPGATTPLSPNKAETIDELFAEKDAEGKISALPLVFPGVEEEPIGEVVILESPPVQTVPIPDFLPQTGPADGEETPRTIFPFMIVFAALILGTSGYFALKGKKRT